MTVLPAFEQAGQSFCVPSMALILLVQVQSRVFTAKCSEPQVVRSNPMGDGRDVAKYLSLKLYEKIKRELKRKHAVSQPLAKTFTKLNQIIRGWINYFRIWNMKMFITEFGQWLRNKVRVIIIKQWRGPRTIYKNLQKINKSYKCNFN